MTISHNIVYRIIISGITVLLIVWRISYCKWTICTIPLWSEQINTKNTISDVVYVDVREDDERAAGHVSGAIHLPLWNIEAGQTSILPKDQQLIIYCRSGRRSAIALDILKWQGFTNIIDGWAMTSLKEVEIIQ